MLGVRVLCMIGSGLHQMQKLKCAEALSAMVETEDFQTYKDRYYNANGFDVQTMIEMKERVLADVTSDFSTRKLIRPLIDCIDRAKRAANNAATHK